MPRKLPADLKAWAISVCQQWKVMIPGTVMGASGIGLALVGGEWPRIAQLGLWLVTFCLFLAGFFASWRAMRDELEAAKSAGVQAAPYPAVSRLSLTSLLNIGYRLREQFGPLWGDAETIAWHNAAGEWEGQVTDALSVAELARFRDDGLSCPDDSVRETERHQHAGEQLRRRLAILTQIHHDRTGGDDYECELDAMPRQRQRI